MKPRPHQPKQCPQPAAPLAQPLKYELVPDGVLERMVRDGWVPNEVHRLIASYRELKARTAVQDATKKVNGHG